MQPNLDGSLLISNKLDHMLPCTNAKFYNYFFFIFDEFLLLFKVDDTSFFIMDDAQFLKNNVVFKRRNGFSVH